MLTQKAIDRLLAVKKHILEEPKRFNMQYIRHPRSSAPCGTTCCIAGWLIKLEYPNRRPRPGEESVFWSDGQEEGESGDINEARDLLAIDGFDDSLFFYTGWPTQLQYQYLNARTTDQRAQAGAAAIDAFIAAGGEW